MTSILHWVARIYIKNTFDLLSQLILKAERTFFINAKKDITLSFMQF